MKTLDLALFHAPGSVVLTGGSKGVVLRGALHIGDFDVSDDVAVVVVPEFMTALHVDFFRGVFGQSVQSLGREAFLSKYRFECPPAVLADIGRGIDDVLADESGVPGGALQLTACLA